MKGITARDHAEGKRVDHSTKTRDDGLLDQMGYNTKNGFHTTRESPDGLGIDSFNRVTTYSQRTDKHSPIINRSGDMIQFDNEADARAFIEDQEASIKEAMVVEDRPVASIDEKVRRLEQIQRHRKQKEDGSYRWDVNSI